MKTTNHSLTRGCGIIISVALLLSSYQLFASDKPSLVDTRVAVAGAVKDAQNAIQDAGESAARSFDKLWERIDAQRLKNRTPDQLVAWAIMGALVGSVAGMMTGLKSTGLGRLGRLLLGLAGAFLGGTVLNVARLDFGWGPVLIRYEELLFSFAGALLLIVAGKLLRSKSKKQPQ